MITSNDVKILKSERLTDEDDGGGRATGTPVIDNEMNNLFPDISRLDRTTGRISLRKVFAGVVTQTNDPYLGSHAILTEAPKDPRVSVLLFNTGSQTDTRMQARDSIESYMAPASSARFELMGNQLVGQRAIVGVQREEQAIPDVGEVFQLICTAGNQFVRVTSVETNIETFVHDYSSGNWVTFDRRRLVLSLSSPLTLTFPGGEVVPTGTSGKSVSLGLDKSQVLSTQIADAARYYGIAPAVSAVNEGDLQVKVNNIYSQLVPSTSKENALLSLLGGYDKTMVIPSGDSRDILITFVFSNNEARAYTGTAVVKGSLSFNVNGGIYRDDYRGNIVRSSGSNWIAKGTIDYETGEILLSATASSTFSGTLTYQPGAAFLGSSITDGLEVTLGSRGYVYTLDLSEATPRPGTLTVSYMVLGRWYTLQDYGSGELTGEGAGLIDFGTGAVGITLSALPDVGSMVLYSYISSLDSALTRATGYIPTEDVRVTHKLEAEGLKPNSVVVTWEVGGVTKTATDNGVGLMQGDATGRVVYITGEIELVMTATPDSTSQMKYAYEQGSTLQDVLTNVSRDGAGMATFTIKGAPLRAGSVELQFMTTRVNEVPTHSRNYVNQDIHNVSKTVMQTVKDNGSGGWVGRNGTIDYTTGQCWLQVEADYTYPTYYYYNKNGWQNKIRLASTNITAREGFGGTISVKAQEASIAYGSLSEFVQTPPMKLGLLGGRGGVLIPSSVIFVLGGKTYIERSGVVYTDINSRTNAGVAVGSLDYNTGQLSLTSYPSGNIGSVQLIAGLTHTTGFTVNTAVFRTASAPIRPASLQVSVVRADTGEVVTATASLNGLIDKGIIKGTVDHATGIVNLRFTTDLEDDTGASEVPVIPTLIRYNAVVQTLLPLDANLIGLDPVRLPSDGRVPIFREGDVVVLHNTVERTVNSPSPGGLLELGRNFISYVEVVGAEGRVLPDDQYTVNLEAGTLLWANPLVLQDTLAEPLALPLTVRNRVEHMALVTEAQITGDISLSGSIPWTLPAEGTYLSSAVTWGDMQARLFNWFTQQSWNTSSPNWTDKVIGGTTTAQYNSLSYPQIVSNMGSIDGKWALVFTSNTSFNVVEQALGVVATGSVATDCSPINAMTGTPYFTIKREGWGTGWAANNAVRFNTSACLGPLWIVRTVVSGKGTVEDDNFKLQVRGDAD